MYASVGLFMDRRVLLKMPRFLWTESDPQRDGEVLHVVNRSCKYEGFQVSLEAKLQKIQIRGFAFTYPSVIIAIIVKI
jgi:hypothetical protein